MAKMIVAHPIPGFSGRVAVEEVGLSFVGGFTGPVEVPAHVQAQLTAEGFTLNADPEQSYTSPYLTPAALLDSGTGRVLDEKLPARLSESALRAAFVPFWKPAEVVTAGTIRVTSVGLPIQRIADGTTRGSYDATEAAAWTVMVAPLVNGKVPNGNIPIATRRTRYVTATGNDSNDGLSWLTPKRTITAALASVTGEAPEILVEGGEYTETVTLDKAYTRITGHSNTSAGGPGVRIKPPTATASGLVIQPAAQGSVIEGITVHPTVATYTGIKVDLRAHNVHMSDVRIAGENDSATATEGGTGLRIENTEGCLFERMSISESNLGVHFVNEATQNVLVDTVLSRNWADLKMAGNSGSNTIIRYKGTASRNDGTSHVVEIGGNGANNFINLDVDEAFGPVTGVISSHHNTFIGCTVSPQLTITASGNYNLFQQLRLLKTLNLTGTNNRVDGAYMPAGATLTDTGTRSIIENLENPGGTYTPSGGPVGTRTRSLSTQVWSRPRATGRWYANSFGSFVGAVSGATGNGVASLIYVGGPATWDQISVEITAADAAAVISLSLWRVDPDTLLPTTLIADAGTVTGDTTGLKPLPITASSTGLWVAAVATITAQSTGLTLRGLFPQNGEFGPYGFATGALNARSGIAATMPTMGTGPAKTTWVAAAPAGNDLGVMLRRSA